MRTARGQVVDLDEFEALDQGETLHRSVTQGLSCERRGYAIGIIGWRACASTAPGGNRAKTWDVLQNQEVKP